MCFPFVPSARFPSNNFVACLPKISYLQPERISLMSFSRDISFSIPSALIINFGATPCSCELCFRSILIRSLVASKDASFLGLSGSTGAMFSGNSAPLFMAASKDSNLSVFGRPLFRPRSALRALSFLVLVSRFLRWPDPEARVF